MYKEFKMKPEKQEMSKNLRRQGLSINAIANQLEVSKGSVSKWVKDIELTPEQIEKLKEQNPIINRQISGNKVLKQLHHNKRLSYQKDGMIAAKKNNPLHIAGCMLYWGEGSKSRHNCELTNSDPVMIKFFIKFIKECFNKTNNDFKIHINYYTNNGLSVQDIESYWHKELQLPKECFGKTTADNISKYSHKKKSKNKLLYGTIKIRVIKSVSLVQHIYGAIQEYTGVYNNYCID